MEEMKQENIGKIGGDNIWRPESEMTHFGYKNKKIISWLNPKGEPATYKQMNDAMSDSYLGNRATGSHDYEILEWANFKPIYEDDDEAKSA
jgi:hypothetical protein